MGQMFTHPGILKVLGKHLKPGLFEMKNSLYKRGYLELVRKYCPSLTLDDLTPYPAGVRAQAVSKDGKLVDDFFVREHQAHGERWQCAVAGGHVGAAYRGAYRRARQSAVEIKSRMALD